MEWTENELVRRIQQLERRSRVATGVTVATLMLLVLATVGGAGPEKDLPTDIKATRIIVVDDQGKPRVVIGQDPSLVRDSYLARTIRRIPILRDRGKGFPPEWVRERILAPVVNGFSHQSSDESSQRTG